jgi:hypothetical protein
MAARVQKILLVLLAVMVIGIVLATMLFTKAVAGWQAAMRAGNEAATVQNLKTIAVVEATYFYTHNRSFGTIEQLIGEQSLSRKFAANPVDGYNFVLAVTPEQTAFSVTADPVSEGAGAKHFYLDSVSHQIHFNSAQRAGPNDPVFGK